MKRTRVSGRSLRTASTTSSSLSLAEIATQVGYGSETALSRAYKRWVGVAPAEWRRSKQSGAVPEP